MLRALLRKSFDDSRWILLSGTCTLLVFAWSQVWLTSQLDTRMFRKLLRAMPENFRSMLPSGIDIVALAEPAGRLAWGFEHPLVWGLVLFWVISRGSDVISGELGRGTLEMMLSQPIRRLDWLLCHTAVSVAGVITLAGASWLGLYIGIHTVELLEPIDAALFWPSAVNLLAMGLFVLGLATLFSSWDSSRTRTVGLTVGFVAIQLLQTIVGKMAPEEYYNVKRLDTWAFFSRFEPVVMMNNFRIDAPDKWDTFFDYNGELFVLGLVAFAFAAARFVRRDLPAPL